ncbi:alpha/beta fold hydrolase [Marinobacter sediminum]|uniref:alpha/beta fold hydrolase n=1 Tax=Marinobacter sediminum TaxID=256323 RepID=UPI0020305AFD|nr:alpha/beta fold hydrolase [Marinobacter sediminum]MCM0613038.1 alpha/beta fold hydrolase [Marinobacter sediminum]
MQHPQSTGMKAIDYADHKFLQIHGAEYCYLEAGKGPMVLLIHGYPDNAYSWEHQIRFLAQNGYRVIAPFTRGYAPTRTAENGYFDCATLALDMATLIDHLNDGKPAFLVGQDWGAAISYGENRDKNRDRIILCTLVFCLGLSLSKMVFSNPLGLLFF